MNKQKAARKRKIRRASRTRAKIHGTPARPRLAVFRSNTFLYAQLIDDESGSTLASCSTRELPASKDPKVKKSYAAGELLAKKAVAAGISGVVFDRGSYRYHGQVAAFAEGARHGGLTF